MCQLSEPKQLIVNTPICILLDVLVKFTKVILSSSEGEFFFLMLNVFSSVFFNLECSFEKQRKDTLWPPS